LITSASFLSVVLTEVKDVCVLWLNVDGERARTLIATLVYITCSGDCGIVVSQHWHNPIGPFVPAMYDLTTCLKIDRGGKHEEHKPHSTNAVDAETNPSNGLANHSTVLQSLVNTLD
jgi:hypothetical protein